ncbi:unnamed protein product [Linum trigynum]|uniref:Uncharacterized protein n=1 Tax=Linum trigynum TaxID=586398 RepID=A0AAV2E6G5_9ROSI
MASSSIRELLVWVAGFKDSGASHGSWLSIFFLKDGLNVDSSTLQLLQNSANIPMVVKPLYGVISDAIYISDQHCIPYIAVDAIIGN